MAHLAELLSTPRRRRDGFATGGRRPTFEGAFGRLDAVAPTSHQFDARMMAGRSRKASAIAAQEAARVGRLLFHPPEPVPRFSF
jgi:hypothetical protein